MSIVRAVHERLVFGRRIRILADSVCDLLPPDADVLDVGCGDGKLDRLIMDQRADVRLSGLEVLVRSDAQIPVELFDGLRIPRDDNSVDAVLMVDVLHHTSDPSLLLAEAARVARSCVVLKDHTVKGRLARPTLRVMDWVGNAPRGVALPYNYWTEKQWLRAFREIGLTPSACRRDVGLYPPPVSWIFGRSLHFVARLDVYGSGNRSG